MVQKSRITGNTGGNSKERETHVHPFETANGKHTGLIALTHRLIETEPSTVFFTNDTVGIAMNQNVTFGAIASIIHDGGTSSNRGTGNADSNVTNKLIDSVGTPFDDVVVGMSVENTDAGTYANVVTVEDNNTLLLDADIFPAGTEAYEVDAVWVGTAVQGAWNFADSGKITLTSGNNSDEASFDANALASYNMGNFTALTGKIDLDTYSDINTNIIISFDLNSIPVGNSVTLDDFIDTGSFLEQSFVIPKASLGLTTQEVNGFTVSIVRLGGAKPTFKLDDIQLESSGTPLIFNLNVQNANRFHIQEIVFTYVDNITSLTTVSGATQNATDPFFSYNKILGLNALTNGFVITRTKAGKTLFSSTIRTLGQHISAGAKADTPLSDGANTIVVLRAIFSGEHDLVLTGNVTDTLTIQINDDMSGLVQFTVAARGGLET